MVKKFSSGHSRKKFKCFNLTMLLKGFRDEILLYVGSEDKKTQGRDHQRQSDEVRQQLYFEFHVYQ